MHKLPVRHLTATLSDEEVRLLKGTLIEPHQIATIVTKSEIGIMPNGQPLYALVTEAFPYRYCDQAYLPALKVASDPVIGGMRADAAGVKLQPRMRKDGTLGGRLEVPFTERLVGAKTGHFGFYDYEDGRLQGRLTDFSATNWVCTRSCTRLHVRWIGSSAPTCPTDTLRWQRQPASFILFISCLEPASALAL